MKEKETIHKKGQFILPCAVFAGVCGLFFASRVLAGEGIYERLRSREIEARDNAHAEYQVLDAAARQPVLEQLFEDLKSKDLQSRRDTAVILSTLPWKKEEWEFARPALLSALRDEDYFVREQIVQLLGNIGTAAQETVPELIRLLDDRYVCAEACWALGRMGPAGKEAVPALIAVVERGRYWGIHHSDSFEEVYEDTQRPAIEALQAIDPDTARKYSQGK